MYKISLKSVTVAMFAHLRDAIYYGRELAQREEDNDGWQSGRVVRLTATTYAGRDPVLRRWQVHPYTVADELVLEVIDWEIEASGISVPTTIVDGWR